MVQEFLPLCDVLFNIISLASYFCDIVFDVVTVYTLYLQKNYVWFSLALGSIMTSLLISQLLSLQWHYSHKKNGDASVALIFLMHLFQFGVLWRYFKLFMPVDLANVKNDVRDLCMLRLIHGFCEAAPMLLIQLYLIWLKPSSGDVSDLNIVSTIFSLFSICWALASFNKNVRQKNIHRLVLTWLGVIFQFLWRLGTVSSRAVALTVYATLYHYWVFVVIALHWLSMFLWIISPKNVFHGESISRTKKIGYSIVIAYVYIFCYVNLQEIKPRQKMIAFYVTMFLENTLLVAIWLGLQDRIKWYYYPTACIVWGGFAIGLLFMFLYYRFFHIRRLKHLLSETVRPTTDCTTCSSDHSTSNMYFICENSNGDPSKSQMDGKASNGMAALYQNGMVNTVPGVFNCRLNPAFKRKKKKPSSFVPPPTSIQVPVIGNGKMVNPFWKKPPVKYYSSDHESVSSRVNIQQKLQEKKQQQLQELKEIEEEIKQGKLKRPHPLEISEQGTLRQPIPTSKKQPTLQPEMPSVNQHQFLYQNILGYPIRMKGKQRSQTPEILLSPHYLDNSRIYYDYQDPNAIYSIIPNSSLRHRGSDVSSNSNVSNFGQRRLLHSRNKLNGDLISQHKIVCKPYCVPSDLDSQISLPRSYTLPREFRYYRRPKVRKLIRSELMAASNNSSDGDVDSLDENEPDVVPTNRPPRSRMYPLPLRSVARQLHETKL